MNRIRTDFSKTEERGLPPEGINLVTVDKVYEKTSSQGNEMIVFELATRTSWTLYHYCMNTGNNRWMLKKTLEAITGIKQPKGEVYINTDDLIGKILKVEVFHDKYNSKMNAKVADVISEDSITGDDDIANAKTEDESLPF